MADLGFDLQTVRYAILAELPYFRELLFKLQPIPMHLNGAYMAVDKSCRWYIDVEKCKDKSLAELCGMTVHEMLHVIENHFERGKNLTVVGSNGIPLWGRGTDKAINCKFGCHDGIRIFKLPEDCLHPTKEGQPVNLMAEEYYALDLEKEEEKEQERKKEQKKKEQNKEKDKSKQGDKGQGPEGNPLGQKDQDKDGGNSDGKADSGKADKGKPQNGKSDSGKPEPGKPQSGKPEPGKGDDQSDDSEGEGDEEGPQTGQGKCGSCSGPGTYPWEINGGDPDPSDEDTPGVSQIEIDRTVKQVAKDIKEFSDKTPGKVPGSLKRWSEEHLKSKVNWHNELKHALINTFQIVKGKLHYSYSKRSRRQVAFDDVILPGFVGSLVHVVIVMDTSASMRQSYLDQGEAEVMAILKHLDCEVTLISCDARVHSSTVLKSKKDIKFEGGGGTDLSVGYNFIKTLKPKANIIIFITDCETPWPKEALPGTKNLIVNTNENLGDFYKTCLPKWAKVFHLNVTK